MVCLFGIPFCCFSRMGEQLCRARPCCVIPKIGEAGEDYVGFMGRQPVSVTLLEALALFPEFNRA